MTLANFEINSDMISLDFQNQNLDLHNCYMFVNLTQKKSIKSADLLLERLNESWVNESLPKSLVLKFTNIREVFFNEPLQENTSLESDQNTLDIFGFSFAGNEEMRGPADHRKSRLELSTLLFTFVTGKSIKIDAEQVELQTY